MGPLISGKSRLVKYYSIWPDYIPSLKTNSSHLPGKPSQRLETSSSNHGIFVSDNYQGAKLYIWLVPLDFFGRAYTKLQECCRWIVWQVCVFLYGQNLSSYHYLILSSYLSSYLYIYIYLCVWCTTLLTNPHCFARFCPSTRYFSDLHRARLPSARSSARTTPTREPSSHGSPRQGGPPDAETVEVVWTYCGAMVPGSIFT